MKEKTTKYKLPDRPELPFRIQEAYFEDAERRILKNTTGLAQLPFETPPFYFEQLPEKIEQGLAPFPNKLPFETPEEYFDTLASKIQERKSKTATRNWHWHWGYSLGAAAAAIVTFVVVLLLPTKETNTELTATQSSQEILASIDKQELQHFLEQSRMDDEVILDMAEEKDITLPEFGEAQGSTIEKELWEKELELEDLDDLDLEM